MRQTQTPYQLPRDEAAGGEDLEAVNTRLSNLTRQLERMAQEHGGAATDEHQGADKPQTPDRAPDRVAETLARLDRRLEEVIDEGRRAAQAAENAPPAQPSPSPVSAAPSEPSGPASSTSSQPSPHNTADWAAQILARQRVLDSESTDASTAAARWQPDFASLERQLRQIDTRISSLQLPYDKALTALRGDLAEIGRALTEALPRQAIESLQAEVRVLAEHLERSQKAGADGAGLQALQRELAEVRQFLSNLTPAENLAGFEEAVRGLSDKIERMASAAEGTRDPATVEKVGEAVASLRGVVSNIASDDTIAHLVAEVRRLGAQFERATASNSAETLARLETRINALTESGHIVPPSLEEAIRALSERLDRMQLSRSDQLVLGSLEDRIAGLSEKLDASGARLNHLEAIERGLADLLVHLEEIRNDGIRSLQAAAAAAPLDTGFTDLVHPRVPFADPRATDADDDEPLRPSPARAMPRPPIDPTLPPDTPLEPGTSHPRAKPGSKPGLKPGSAAARIAASEAALGITRPATTENGGRLAAIAAARNAARAASREASTRDRGAFGLSFGGKMGGWLHSLAAKAAALASRTRHQAEDTAEPMAGAASAAVPSNDTLADDAAPVEIAPTATSGDDMPIDRPLSRRQRILSWVKTILIALSVVAIVVGAAQTVMELLFSSNRTPAPTVIVPKTGPATPHTTVPGNQTFNSQTFDQQAFNSEAFNGSAPGETADDDDDAAPADDAPADTADSHASFFSPVPLNPPQVAAQPTPLPIPAPKAPNDVTGSISPRAGAPRDATAGSRSSLDALPASIGPALRMAAAANDPAAEYELATRYAEGRGVPQDLAEAVRWLQRAADAGFAPAQFRLGSLKEKGEGTKKDLQAARRLYLAAARKGHAKAMHNLAVLYAEGVDGKPDYAAAADWFRKAANHGVADSQFNLAILYARGIGVPADLAAAYRWFALAAAKGDADAAHKRDQVGSQLDQYALASAKRAAQAFVPEREPDEATNLRVPPGGWDRATPKSRN